MSTPISVDVDALVALVRQLAQERIAPRARDIDLAAAYPQDVRELAGGQ